LLRYLNPRTDPFPLFPDFKRLEYLKQVNDNIREEELVHARKAITKLDKKLADARLRLDAIRVISAS